MSDDALAATKPDDVDDDTLLDIARIPHPDPERLREDRRKVNLGEEETAYDRVSANVDDVPAGGDTVVGIVPPAR